MAKIVCVLYDYPVTGYPPSYARDDVPKLDRYPDGQLLPTPKALAFKPGELLGSVSGELGLRNFLEDQGHSLVVTVSQRWSRLCIRKRIAGRRHGSLNPFGLRT